VSRAIDALGGSVITRLWEHVDAFIKKVSSVVVVGKDLRDDDGGESVQLTDLLRLVKILGDCLTPGGVFLVGVLR